MTDKLTKQLFLLLAAGLPLASHASPPETGPQPIPLYGENTPAESNGMSREGVTLTADILTGAADADYFLLKPDPDKTSGMAVVICPGGGYGCTCYGYEGLGPAEWLREQGILAVVLRYRVPNGHGSIPLADAEQALRTVRSHAAEWGVNPSRIGVMGFSAGGHLAASALTLFEFSYARPDFGILIYPVITMQDGFSHGGSRDNLMGKDPSEDLIRRFSTERHIVAATEHTPATSPCFIALSSDDEVVPTRNSTMFYDSLCSKGVPAELHVYPTGRHGWIGDFVYWDEYHASLSRWLKQLRKKAAAADTACPKLSR